MEQGFALPTLAALALTLLLGSPALPATGEVAKPGTIVTVAGTGQPGYSGDHGPATEALLNFPSGLALDAAGNLYIAEAFGHRVRKVDAVTGTITTVAGTGTPGFSGDGGKAADAQLFGPEFVVVDGSGNLFITDGRNHRVRKVTPDGLISTYAGSGPSEEITNLNGTPTNGGFSGDSGPATEARLNHPEGLAVDALGNLLIADSSNHRVRRVDVATGTITTVAGNGIDGFSGDGGLATEAEIAAWALAIDAEGDLFIADNPVYSNRTVYRVRKVTPDGKITTVAGTGTPGFSGDGGPAIKARLSHPAVLAVDSAGNLFISDWNNYRVRKVDAVTGVISTIAGSGRKKFAGDGSLATQTGLRGPGGLVIDAAGNLFISDSGYFHEGDGLPHNDRVLKLFGAAAPGLLAGMAFPR